MMMQPPAGMVRAIVAILFVTAEALAAPQLMTLPTGVINRHSQGDIFSLPTGDCSPASCSSALGHVQQPSNGSSTATRPGRTCQCQCPPEQPVYREDIRQCVNTIEECSLADYVNGLQSEKVPFVFLPSQGQLINPNAEIALSDVRAEGQMVVSPVCVVSKAHFLTGSGWMPTDGTNGNASSLSESGMDLTELPFALARESGRTHLQWLGESRLRSLMEGRIVLVKLLCKDTANVRIGVFSPCIAFRVAGSPGLFEAVLSRSGIAAESAVDGAGIKSGRNKTGGLRQADYLAIGISAGLLGALYVAGLVGYLCYRRRKRQLRNNDHTKLVVHPSSSPEGNSDDNNGIIRIQPPMEGQQQQQSNSQRHHQQRFQRAGEPSARSDKNFQNGSRRHLGPSPGNASSPPGMIHQAMNYARYMQHQQPQSMMMMDERYHQQQQQDPSGFYYGRHHPDAVAAAAAAAAAAMNSRRIFFSPAYFDPELLRSPPPAALEFLARIRGMIDVAKDKMSSRRFMPSLVDIPEEQLGAAYGATNAAGLRRNSSLNQADGGRASYGTLKNTGQTLLKNSLKRNKTSSDEEQGSQLGQNEQQLYRPVELRATNFLQKSPLPARKTLDGLNGQQYGGIPLPSSSIYTNPSIDDIYRSLDRLKSEPTSGRTGKTVAQVNTKKKKKTALSEMGDNDSDAVSDLVSEAESKMPKITTGTPAKTYFEPDSLDRVNINKSNQMMGGKSHLYQKNSKAAQHQRTPSRRNEEPALQEEADEANGSAGYTSSTCTSVQSLSRVLPAQEAMEVGNQLFNMRTGAPTLPRPGGSHAGDGRNTYDVVRQLDKGNKTGLFVNHEFRKPLPTPTKELLDGSSSSSNESSSSKVTVLEDSSCPASLSLLTNQSKLTIQVESNPSPDGSGEEEEEGFEPDTLERNKSARRKNHFGRQPSGFMDSLERPVQQVKSTISQLLGNNHKSSSGGGKASAPISPASAGSNSSSGVGSSISATSHEWITVIKKDELPPPGSVVSLRQMYSRKNPQRQHPHPHPHQHPHPVVSKPPEETKPPGADPGSSSSSPIPPPLPLKSLSSAPAIPRNLKPSPVIASVHHHPEAKHSKEGAPSLPPKNGRGGSSGKAGATSSAPPTSLSPPTPPPAKSPNVLERIARIEQESRALSSSASASSGQHQTKGMEIALALKARMASQQQQQQQELEGSVRDGKKTNSLKKKWRKLLDKVEDSFSETSESAVSTLVRSSKGKKQKHLPATPDEEEEETVDDSSSSSSSRSGTSLGSDGTGKGGPALDAPQLKSYYTFGQDLLPSTNKGGSSSSIQPSSIIKASNNVAGNKLYSTYQTSIGDY